METLREKIRREGNVIGTEIVKVDNFLNHQMDVKFLEEVGREFGRRFRGIHVDKILTVESSGIAIACLAAPHFGYVPVVFAKKAAPNTMNEGFYEAEARSFTKGTVSKLKVDRKYINKGERVLILDDFLASGEASVALANIVEAAGAEVAGVGAVIEKGYQGGADRLFSRGYRVESLAVIRRIENGRIEFRLKKDLHIHTTASDGEAAPADIVKRAAELRYDVIAITDHDNTDGLDEAMRTAESAGIKVIPGIEIAVETEEGIGLHMLGYNIDRENSRLKIFLERMIENRKVRNVQLFNVLQEMGYDIAEEDIEIGKNEFIGKPLIARALVKKGYIKNESQAFSREILGSDKCRKVKKVKPLAADAIKLIVESGGTPVLAHPIQTRNVGKTGSREFYDNIDRIIGRLVQQGLKGLECYHPDQDMDASARFTEIADKYGLEITRGSDFHGKDFAFAENTANER